ncbi:MAG: hypothetical protein C4547_04135 [Phycisphaerales bacterium]|nr:MAG: hypothetical protein C4547_04135 [Phycisphaerales bacterium]
MNAMDPRKLPTLSPCAIRSPVEGGHSARAEARGSLADFARAEAHGSLAGAAAVILATFALTAGGCDLLKPLVFLGEHKQKVAAEFDKLRNTRTAILVWAEPETLFHYPNVRLELSAGIRGQLVSKLTGKESRVDIVDPAEVEDFVQRKRSAAIDPIAVGREFKCDYVVFVELLTFQIRDPDSPELLQARIEAAVSVHDVHADPDQPRRYTVSPVTTIHPESGPVLMTPSNPLIVRQEAYRKFSEQVAGRFYDHTVEL